MRAAILAAVCLLLGLTTQSAAQVFEDHGGADPPYRLFLPPGLDPARPVPLVVMLHGCNQDARAFAEVTRMNDLAAAEGFVVLYPEQRAHPIGCWRWYEPAQQVRDQGHAIIFVSHNMDIVRELSDHIIVLDSGRLLTEGEGAPRQ